jgi:hypothetical protein
MRLSCARRVKTGAMRLTPYCTLRKIDQIAAAGLAAAAGREPIESLRRLARQMMPAIVHCTG